MKDKFIIQGTRSGRISRTDTPEENARQVSSATKKVGATGEPLPPSCLFKRRFASSWEAEVTADTAYFRGGPLKRPEWCPRCDAWHLTPAERDLS